MYTLPYPRLKTDVYVSHLFACSSLRVADEPFFVLLVVIFIYFIVEIVANSIVRQDYMLSMFFWFDILGAISLIPDIPWLSESSLLARASLTFCFLTIVGRQAKVSS